MRIKMTVLTTVLMSSSIQPALAADWRGLHVGVGIGMPVGDSAFGLGHQFSDDNRFSLGAISYDLTGELYSLTAGYRWSVGSLRFGPSLGLHHGELRSSENYQVGPLQAGLDFKLETLTTIGLEVGYVPPQYQQWYGYIAGGMAAGESTLVGQVTYDQYDRTASTAGWVMGEYATIGLKRKVTDNASLGLSLSQYRLDATEQCIFQTYDCGTFVATVSPTVLGVHVEWDF